MSGFKHVSYFTLLSQYMYQQTYLTLTLAFDLRLVK